MNNNSPSSMDGLVNCPFCNKRPIFEPINGKLVGGCPRHIPGAVDQPVDMPEQAVIQWNAVVKIMKPVTEVA